MFIIRDIIFFIYYSYINSYKYKKILKQLGSSKKIGIEINAIV